jgi:hypothetical protein
MNYGRSWLMKPKWIKPRNQITRHPRKDEIEAAISLGKGTNHPARKREKECEAKNPADQNQARIPMMFRTDSTFSRGKSIPTGKTENGNWEKSIKSTTYLSHTNWESFSQPLFSHSPTPLIEGVGVGMGPGRERENDRGYKDQTHSDLHQRRLDFCFGRIGRCVA